MLHPWLPSMGYYVAHEKHTLCLLADTRIMVFKYRYIMTQMAAKCQIVPRLLETAEICLLH